MEDIDVSRRPHGAGGGCSLVRTNTEKFTVEGTRDEEKRWEVRVATCREASPFVSEEERNDKMFFVHSFVPRRNSDKNNRIREGRLSFD